MLRLRDSTIRSVFSRNISESMVLMTQAVIKTIIIPGIYVLTSYSWSRSFFRGGSKTVICLPGDTAAFIIAGECGLSGHNVSMSLKVLNTYARMQARCSHHVVDTNRVGASSSFIVRLSLTRLPSLFAGS
jgi:hypothetical protein